MVDRVKAVTRAEQTKTSKAVIEMEAIQFVFGSCTFTGIKATYVQVLKHSNLVMNEMIN